MVVRSSKRIRDRDLTVGEQFPGPRWQRLFENFHRARVPRNRLESSRRDDWTVEARVVSPIIELISPCTSSRRVPCNWESNECTLPRGVLHPTLLRTEWRLDLAGEIFRFVNKLPMARPQLTAASLASIFLLPFSTRVEHEDDARTDLAPLTPLGYSLDAFHLYLRRDWSQDGSRLDSATRTTITT